MRVKGAREGRRTKMVVRSMVCFLSCYAHKIYGGNANAAGSDYDGCATARDFHPDSPLEWQWLVPAVNIP